MRTINPTKSLVVLTQIAAIFSLTTFAGPYGLGGFSAPGCYDGRFLEDQVCEKFSSVHTLEDGIELRVEAKSFYQPDDYNTVMRVEFSFFIDDLEDKFAPEAELAILLRAIHRKVFSSNSNFVADSRALVFVREDGLRSFVAKTYFETVSNAGAKMADYLAWLELLLPGYQGHVRIDLSLVDSN